MSHGDPGPVPNRWLNCPRKAVSLLANKILAFKTPLGPQFNDKVPEMNRFTPAMLFNSMKSYKVKMGLWVDLTNTSRFYDKKQVEEMDCRYVKLQCRGHGETPSADQTSTFIQLVTQFLNKNPLDVVGVHCTHGFNRTGFLIVSYMVEQCDCSLEAALNEFAKARPPGIYKQDYLDELRQRYGEDFTAVAPALPEWCNEEEDIDYDDGDEDAVQRCSDGRVGKPAKGRREATHKKAVFMAGVRGVEPFNAQPRLAEVQRKVQAMCGWGGKGFPGSQPVTMRNGNISNLQKKPYRVSWKADGQRYLMLVEGEGEVYFLDRDNCAFKVHGLRFVHKKDLRRHLRETLLDGEMVIDKVNGREFPRYLVYDIVKFEGQDIGKDHFYPDRLRCIENDIVNPRHEAMKEGIIDKRKEPFSIRNKQFWELHYAHQLLGDKFAKSLSHEPDGLIFQPSLEPYVPGRCDSVLKWKPTIMNSVDFQLKIAIEEGEGIVRKKIGQLFVGQLNSPFATMKLTKELRSLDNKIIECKCENNRWVYMRERTDKSFPNAYTTAEAVVSSMRDPVTKEKLLDYIDNHRFLDDSEAMPPPKRARR